MRYWLLLLLPFSLAAHSLAQSPYQVSWPRETAIAGGSLAGIAVNRWVLKPRVAPFTPAQIARLDPSTIPSFDRYATRHFDSGARRASDLLLYAALAVPVLSFADPAIRHDAATVGALYGEVFLTNLALTSLTKVLVHRPRPFNYNPAAPMSDKLQLDARMSFFSGHTSTVAAMTFATAKVWTDFHPGSRWKPVVWGTAAAIPAAVGFCRVQAGKHFLSDVVTGFAVGAATGWLIPQLHRVKR